MCAAPNESLVTLDLPVKLRVAVQQNLAAVPQSWSSSTSGRPRSLLSLVARHRIRAGAANRRTIFGFSERIGETFGSLPHTSDDAANERADFGSPNNRAARSRASRSGR